MTTGTLAPATAGLDRPNSQHAMAMLAEAAQLAEANSLSEQTRRLYSSDWRRFTAWCSAAGVDPMPASVETVRAYAASMALGGEDSGYRPATIERHLAAIGYAHTAAGHSPPTKHPAVENVMRGIRRALGSQSRQMRPLLLADVRTIISDIDTSSWPAGLAGLRDTFVLLGGFASAMRRSEMAAMLQGHIRHDPAVGLLVTIPRSKGDQAGYGALVVMPAGQNPQTCPPCAYRRWMIASRAALSSRAEAMAAVFETPVFEDRQEHVCDTPARHDDAQAPVLRIIRRGGNMAGPISGDGLHRMIQRRAAEAGLSGPIGFHSLRAGFVTQARRNGADHRAVRQQTRHTSDALVDRYDREHFPLIDNAAADLGL
ncbi:tyrosine-type recombinase/integrase [Nesterenkonia lacusekhoensis]|uniref:Site-specific recombinase XerD n=1 Tax=Nesterenkonia lacusekhoensis TaxID=150832 RepID=A0ABS4T133_9MICC|nr:tyrosine-type recombinase/integrase [Nesterenkonia lacusekhoensis]MBP2317724.1 site-specific recombinase XerD [Nesterenkonia lacusekhoensis]